MSKLLDRGMGKHAEGRVAWHFICSLYFFNFPSVPSSWTIACCGLPNIRELKNHDEVHDDDICWLGKNWNENVSFGGKKET